MKIVKYKKDLEYSYTLGAFPTIELLKNKKDYVLNVYIHSSFTNKKVIDEIVSIIGKSKIICDDKVFDKLSEKDNTYVIGIFKKYETSADFFENHVILDNISNMGNLGTIIRSSLGFNIKNIIILNNNIDIFDPKVIRASMGSIFSCNILKLKNIDEYQKLYQNHIIFPFMLNAKHELQSIKFENKLSSLVFGNESSGLNEEEYKNFESIVISHSKAIDSLNITNAVSIALYEFNKQVGK